MADEIKLKAPTVEQQVVVNINGEDKLKSFADTLDKISNNKNLQKYWKTQQDLINATADAYSNFQRKASKENASELIKVTNALKAMSGTDLSNILPDFDKISKSMIKAQKIAGDIDSAFSVKGFKEAFDSFETLKAYGTDIQKLFSHFGVNSDIGELQQNVRLLEGEVEKLTKKLINAKNDNEELRNEFENFKVGSGFADKLDELDRLKAEMQNIRDEATQTFNQFLDANKIDRYDWFNDDRFAEYFEKLENGTFTASEAIRQFKTEYDYLLEESFKSNGNSFGLDQLQAFSTKLDSIFHQVEETSNKINDILSNGVIAKSVQNLSKDTALSDAQRSIFGNILQDEESLKSITALFQKLIDETNQTKNTEVFNTEQFIKIESLFTSIESSLSSIKGVLVDVGDGEELSPLLKTITNVESGIDKLSSSVKGIGLNMNIDFGSDTEMEAKAQAKISNALQAYQRLFDHIKSLSAGGSLITQKFFDFDINQFDTPMSKLQAYKKFIENMRNEAKSMYGGQDVLFADTDKKYWTQASSAMGQVTKTFNEMKAASDTNPLENIFGKTNLTEVLNQLSAIVSKLDEISMSANRFADVFKNGLNVNASVEEIEKLTNRVKELESELAKIKTPTGATPQESNISSGMKDAFPNADTKLDEAVTSAKDLDKTLEQVDIPTDSFDKVLEKLDRTKSELVDIVKITKQSVSDTDGKFHDSYTLKDSRGSTEIYGVNSKTDKGQILRQNIVGYDKKKDELDISKAQLEVDKQLAKEEDNLAKAQQKKAQAFLKEQANYEEDQKKAELIKRQTLAYEELTDTISKYSEVAKRVAGGNADDGDLELMTKLEDKISQLQKQPILSDSQVSKSEKSLVSLYDQLDKIERKLVETNQKSQDKQIVGFDKRLESYTKKTSGYDATIARFNDGGWTSDAYLKNVQAVKDAVKQYEDLLNKLKGKDASLVTSDDISKLDEYEKKIKDTIVTITNMSAAEKGYSQLAGQKEIDKINKILRENSAMSSEAKAKIKAYKQELISGNPSVSLEKIHGEIMKIVNAEELAGRAGRSMFDVIKEKAFYGFAAQIGMYFGFNDIVRYAQQAISTIVDLDDALLDLKKTTSMSSTELNNFYYSANDVAKQMGVTTKSIIEQASAWSRLGYSSNEQATEMAKLSSKFASISPGMDTDQAQEGMVSIMKAWQINPEDVEKEILDPINQLGNKFAESNDDIVEGMKRSAAALAAVGTDYKDAYSLFTGVQEVLQNSEVAGRALRSISMRIRGYDENSEDGFEQTDDELKNITGDLIDLTKTAQHAQGVSIFKEGSTTEFKSLVDYFGEIHDIWNEMSQKQQNDFLQKAFGKTQAQAGAALIQNYDAVKEALAEIDKSAGSADKEMSTVEQTLSYKINALKETWVGCAQQILDRGDLGIAISGLNGVSKVITGLIDNVGLLKTAAMGVAAAFSFKNVGIDTLVAY